MRFSRATQRPRPVRLAAVMSAALALVAAAGVSVANHASAVTPIDPTGLTVSVASNTAGIGGNGVPDVLVQTNEEVTVTITLQPAGATFKSPVTLNLTPTLDGTGQPSGVFNPASVTFPADTTTQSYQVRYTGVDNQVRVNAALAAVKGKPLTVAPGRSAPFDVLKELRRFAGTDGRLATGLGVGNADCTQASTESFCGTLVLARGLQSPTATGALSIGKCTADLLGCSTASQVVQFVGDLGTTYTPQAPALLILRCDKNLCRGKGISSYTINLSFAATGPLNIPSAPCVSKGVALDAAGNEFCTDYVQSHRDNSGDALFYVLFTEDMRAGAKP